MSLLTPTLRLVMDKRKKKRFGYWTPDGKYHWTPLLAIEIPPDIALVADPNFICKHRSEMPTKQKLKVGQ